MNRLLASFCLRVIFLASIVSASCDVNNGGCDRECVDTREGPKCQCPSGFHLHQDGRTCLGILKLFLNFWNWIFCTCIACTTFEIIKFWSFNNLCLYTLVWWGNTLMKKYGTFPVRTDEDECAVSNGGCSHKCLNTEGSYECVCPKGFKVQYNQRVCVGERGF